MPRRLPYFDGPSEDFFVEPAKCSRCGKKCDCFYSRSTRQYGCLSCLRECKFALAHDTEIGWLDGGVLTAWDHHLEESVVVEPPPGFRAEALRDLQFAPWFKSHQESTYLVHCNDFMHYIGRWEPEDFEREASYEPKALFLEIAEGDGELWEATERQKAEFGDQWPYYLSSHWAYGSWVYVFECRKCGIRRCYWDCS